MSEELHWRIQGGGTLETRPPPFGPFFSNFMQFLRKNDHNIIPFGWRPPSGKSWIRH